MSSLPEKWAVVRLSALGDVALTTGVLDYWHRTRGMRFTFITRKAFAPLLEGHPAVEEVVGLEEDELKGRAWLGEARALASRFRNCGLIDLHGSTRTRVLRFFWRGPVHAYPKFSMERRVYLRNRSEEDRLTLERTNVPQRYAMALEEKPPVRGDLLPRIFLTDEERETARRLLQAFSKDAGRGPLAAVHPYATHPGKLWPEDHWRSLVGALDSVGIPWIAVGRGEPLFGGDNDLTNRTSLRETCALLDAADVLVTGDSGPMHLAAAVGTPVVALFGPTVSAWGFAPAGERDVILEAEMDCRPCSLHGKSCCADDVRCMRDIGPERVLAEALARLVGKKAS